MRFNNQTLRLAWHKAVKTLSATHADEAEQEDDEVCLLIVHICNFPFVAPMVGLLVMRKVCCKDDKNGGTDRICLISLSAKYLFVVVLYFENTRGSHYSKESSLCGYRMASVCSSH